MKTRSMHGVSILLLALFVLLALGSGTAEKSVQDEKKGLDINDVKFNYIEIPFSELSQSIKTIDEPGHGFIVNAYFGGSYDDLTICDTPIANRFDEPKNSVSVRNGIHGSSWDDLERRYDKNVVCKIYIKVWSRSFAFSPGELELRPYGIVDRIEGLRSLEEVAAIEAQQKAEREAAEEAERLAREEANRYDPAKFIIVPSSFSPADYTKADLFEAVATSERLSMDHQYLGSLDLGPPSRHFASDVVFVSQNGTDITFRTADNAITKRMKVASRTGLTSGQRVRIYYSAYRIQDWRVIAIERL